MIVSVHQLMVHELVSRVIRGFNPGLMKTPLMEPGILEHLPKNSFLDLLVMELMGFRQNLERAGIVPIEEGAQRARASDPFLWAPLPGRDFVYVRFSIELR